MPTNTLPARPEQVEYDRDWFVAASYLARYRQPTRGTYEIALKQWFDFCAERGVRPLEASRAMIDGYARWLEEVKGLKLSTIAGKLNTICGYYRFARIDHYIVDDPAEYVKRPSIPRVSTTLGLKRSELLMCLDLAQRSHPQDHALWCILSLNGLRVGEAVALNVEDLGRAGGYRTIKVTREKGNRPAEVPMAPRTSWAIDDLLGTRTAGPLFRKWGGRRMDRKAAERVIHRIVKQAGITKRITPHSLRHTFITLALNSGCSVRDVTNSMGYADARQVSYYDRDKDSLARHATHMVAAYVEGA